MTRKLLTKKEAADRLSVSVRTLEGLISRGALPHTPAFPERKAGQKNFPEKCYKELHTYDHY